MNQRLGARPKHEACCVSTAQQSIDESGQMSWQGDLDIPMSYGTCYLLSAHLRNTHTHTGICGLWNHYNLRVFTGTHLSLHLVTTKSKSKFCILPIKDTPNFKNINLLSEHRYYMYR